MAIGRHKYCKVASGREKEIRGKKDRIHISSSREESEFIVFLYVLSVKPTSDHVKQTGMKPLVVEKKSL